MDPLETVFVFCFVFGVATTLITVALGALHGGDGGHHAHGPHLEGHVGGHGAHGGALHAGGAHGGGVHGGHGGHGALHEGHVDELSPFNLQTITAFMAFFGGVGWLAYTNGGLGPAIALIVATIAGLAGGGVVFWFLVKVLMRGQYFLDPSTMRMEGTVAKVSRAIQPGVTGEVVYLREGSRQSDGAVSVSGEPIPEGTEVVIVRFERGLAHVEPWASYSGESGEK